jgi:hypothetical protein
MSAVPENLPEDEPRTGLFSQNGHGCLTILRDEPVPGYVSISFTPNDETTTADLEVQTLCVPQALFDSALELAGYAISGPKGRPRRS